MLLNPTSMDMSEYKEPLDTEVEQIMDEALRACGEGPAPRKPAKGIADMQARFKYHTLLIAKLTARLNEPETDPLSVRAQEIERAIVESRAQLREATERIAEYQLLHSSQN